MSAEATITFYGVRFDVHDHEIPALEDRSHPLIIAARRNGLKYYWGNFSSQERRYYLFLGDKLGILGLENDHGIQIQPQNLVKRMTETDARLQSAGIVEPPMLYLEWQADL